MALMGHDPVLGVRLLRSIFPMGLSCSFATQGITRHV
jgi:hypothetical protein